MQEEKSEISALSTKKQDLNPSDGNQSSTYTSRLSQPNNITKQKKSSVCKLGRWQRMKNFFSLCVYSEPQLDKSDCQSKRSRQSELFFIQEEKKQSFHSSHTLEQIYQRQSFFQQQKVLKYPLGLQKVSLDPEGYLKIPIQFGRLFQEENSYSDVCLSLMKLDILTLIVSNTYEEAVVRSAIKNNQQIVYCLLDPSPSNLKAIAQSQISKKVELIICSIQQIRQIVNLDQFETIIAIPPPNHQNNNHFISNDRYGDKQFFQEQLQSMITLFQKHLMKTVFILPKQKDISQIKQAAFNAFNSTTPLQQINLGMKITEIFDDDLCLQDTYSITFCISQHLLALQSIAENVFSFLIGKKRKVEEIETNFSSAEFTTYIHLASLSNIMIYLNKIHEIDLNLELFAYRTIVIDQLLQNNIIPISFIPRILEECQKIDSHFNYVLTMTREQKNKLVSNRPDLFQEQTLPQTKQQKKQRLFKFSNNSNNEANQNKQYPISFTKFYYYTSSEIQPDTFSVQKDMLSSNIMNTPYTFENPSFDAFSPTMESEIFDQQYSTMDQSSGKMALTRNSKQVISNSPQISQIKVISPISPSLQPTPILSNLMQNSYSEIKKGGFRKISEDQQRETIDMQRKMSQQ